MMLMALAGYLAGRMPQHPEMYSPQSLAASLLLVHDWIGWSTPNMPAWSISSEWLAYLCFPLLALLIQRHRVMPVVFGLLAIAGIALVPELPRIVVDFPLGMAVYYLYRRPWRTPAVLGPMILVMLGVVLALTHELGQAYIVLLAALLVAVARKNDWLGAMLSHPVIVYLGEISYSIYMTHWLVRIVLRELFLRLAPSAPPPIIIACYVAATIGAAVMVYHWIEMPGRRLLRSLPLKLPTLSRT
jgi:peptidoglycan/LPS O-acetylase OafA/YrhL